MAIVQVLGIIYEATLDGKISGKGKSVGGRSGFLAIFTKASIASNEWPTLDRQKYLVKAKKQTL